MPDDAAPSPPPVPGLVPPDGIGTARLLLRPFTADDVEARYAYQSLPQVARYLYRPPLTRPQVEASTTGAVALVHDGDRIVLAVVERTGGAVVGEVSATLTSAAAQQVEVGWVLAPHAGGRGLATEAVTALVDAVVTAGVAHRVFARLDAENDRSVRLCERLGMRQEAYLVENDRDGDRWGSELVYAVLAREWLGRTASVR